MQARVEGMAPDDKEVVLQIYTVEQVAEILQIG